MHTTTCTILILICTTMEGSAIIIALQRASARKRKACSRANETVREAEKIRDHERKAQG